MRIKTILLFAVLTATSLSIWGQCKLSPYTQHFVETVRKENISDVQRLKSAYYFKQDDNKGKIIISITHNDEFVNIRVKDNGIGISKNNIDKIFGKYATKTCAPRKKTGAVYGRAERKRQTRLRGGAKYGMLLLL